MTVLVLNAGSSTVKYAFFGSDDLSEGVVERIETSDLDAVVQNAVRMLGTRKVDAIGHRVVHGGTRFREAVVVDGEVKGAIAALSEFAPLHNPLAVEGIEAAERAFPRVPQVAVFDTAFFSELPLRRKVYPLPWSWYADWGIRRFGFHGINHQDCASRAAEMLGRSDLNAVILHLGNGCSGSAVHGAAPVATTMGFTPLEGLPMGTRAGSVDPGILLHVLRRRGVTLDRMEEVLNHDSGLLGVSGISSDFREVEAAAVRGNERAGLAVEILADRARSSVASLAATLGGLDVLVFTGGIGEGSASLRAEVCKGLGFLGIRLDKEKNVSCHADDRISAPDSPVCALVLGAREEFAVARETKRLLVRGE